MFTTPSDRLAVCSWSLSPGNAAELIDLLNQVSIPRTQLALSPLIKNQPGWADAIPALRDAGIDIVSGMFGTEGEDYSTLETIRKTGGIVPDAHWPANRDTAARVAEFAQANGVSAVSFHAGFIPHDPADPAFDKLVGRITEFAGLFEAHGLTLLMETGQETAAALLQLLNTADRANLGVNFDPANMILYGMGDPIASLQQLLPHVRQVHLKDALPSDTPGAWGTEEAIGQGAVDWPAFLHTLNDAGYQGDLVIEREAGSARVQDIIAASQVIAQSQ